MKIIKTVYFIFLCLIHITAFADIDTSADLESPEPTHAAPPNDVVDTKNIPPKGWRKDEKTGWVCSRHGADRKLCRDGKNLWNCYNNSGRWECKSRADFRTEFLK